MVTSLLPEAYSRSVLGWLTKIGDVSNVSNKRVRHSNEEVAKEKAIAVI